MIISHKYKFIFLKTRKTAGTSIEIALSKFCGPDDIITPIEEQDECIRKDLGYRGPQNYHAPFSQYSLGDWKNYIKGKGRRKYYNHISAGEVRRRVGQEIRTSYYKFCFERNPWDKAISLYYYLSRFYNQDYSFSDFIRIGKLAYLSNYYIYTINDTLAVDHIGFYENLSQEIETIASRICLPEKIVLPKAKANLRGNREPYQMMISQQDQEYIREKCQKEIELFGYTF
jgi:hypothetical protein